MEHPDVISGSEEDSEYGAQAGLITSYQTFPENLLNSISNEVQLEVGEILQSLEDVQRKSDIMLSVEIEGGSKESVSENEDTFKGLHDDENTKKRQENKMKIFNLIKIYNCSDKNFVI